jgi:hypothetical protein
LWERCIDDGSPTEERPLSVVRLSVALPSVVVPLSEALGPRLRRRVHDANDALLVPRFDSVRRSLFCV